MATLFGVQKSTVSKHLKNIYDSEALAEKATVSILETVAMNKQSYKIKRLNLRRKSGAFALFYSKKSSLC
ncbi:MAG TPA: hypothetical protein VFU82_02790 [Gammaproteobacteria bacterium]|jgi:hypothetical protein|nr:hypothetical protein [Gammaproteobacteria bacterium]